ncbi:MAG: DegV family protein [Candidatus Limivicinus sp.]|jgi:DegV family protein with EDD domain|nr:DegV family protein [Candidatus Limivicinus sp.]MDY5082418.1 DegV family protein [Candidatus Limivicinus sp.]
MTQLFTDTSANLPAEIIDEYGIEVVPFSYTIDGVEYIPEREFDGKAFYAAMRAGSEVKTSMVNAGTFIERFKTALDAGKDVLYIGMSGGISGTANAALMAKQELDEEYPDRKIVVIDTLAASLGEGLFVIKAAEQLKDGVALDAIEEAIRAQVPSMCQSFTVDDLKYLKNTGRVSGAAAIIGNVLSIHPILIGDYEGKIVVKAKVRGMKRTLDALAERYAELALSKTETIGIAHADNEEGKAYLVQRLRDKGLTGKCLSVCYEPVTGSHVGPGTVALFFFGTDRMG